MTPQDNNEAADGGLPPRTGSPSSATPETDEFKKEWPDNRRHNWPCAFEADAFAKIAKLERERNEEMGYRGQWCDKARKAEAALDALEDLTRELAATKKTLGTLIAWSVVELGEDNTQRLLDMMSPENASLSHGDESER